MTFSLYYWPGIPGRGEFVRLALEDAGASYEDVGRTQGVDAVVSRLEQGDHFAPPILDCDGASRSHVAHILAWLSPRLALAPRDRAGLDRMNQLQLTLTDFVAEIHDTHHPLGPSLYYREQTDAAARASRAFLAERLPTFINYFEQTLASKTQGDDWLVGDQCTTADLSLFQVARGLRYAFPRAMARIDAPKTASLTTRVAERAGIQAYLDSARCIDFNEDGLFRHYPELDEPA